MKIALYGAGNFGFAILKYLDGQHGSKVTVYDRDETLRKKLEEERVHTRLYDGIRISKHPTIAHSPEELVRDADIVILAIPSTAIHDVLDEVGDSFKESVIIVNTAKALIGNGERISKTILKKTRGKNAHYAMFAGGNIAKDFFKHEPLGVTIATDEYATKPLFELFNSATLNIEMSEDIAGTEYAAAFKNSIAILAGIAYGLNFSYGSETHLISRTAGEVEHFLTHHKDVNPKTFSVHSQCWGNDLWMSCTGETRNRKFGIIIGKGSTPEDSIKTMNLETIEGINTVRMLPELFGKKLANYPLLTALRKILEEGAPPRSTILEAIQSDTIYEV